MYLQARYLQPRQRKYDNPASRLVPASPRLGEVRLPGPPVRSDIALVCEGIPDALVAAQAGWRSMAVLGAGLPDERVARAITEGFPDETLVVAFDGDHRGRAGSAALVDLLRREGAGERTTTLEIPSAAGDLNAWAINSGPGFEAELDEALSAAIDSASPGPSTRIIELDDVLETLAYQHLLAATPADVARTVESVTVAIGSWVSGDIEPAGAATPGHRRRTAAADHLPPCPPRYPGRRAACRRPDHRDPRPLARRSRRRRAIRNIARLVSASRSRRRGRRWG